MVVIHDLIQSYCGSKMNFPTFNVELFGMSCSDDKPEGMSKCANGFTQKAGENIETNYDMCRFVRNHLVASSQFPSRTIVTLGLFYS